MQHKTTQNTPDTEQTQYPDTEQPQQRTAHTELYTYSVDFYHEYVAIKNSNTIELYTILQENI